MYQMLCVVPFVIDGFFGLEGCSWFFLRGHVLVYGGARCPAYDERMRLARAGQDAPPTCAGVYVVKQDALPTRATLGSSFSVWRNNRRRIGCKSIHHLRLVRQDCFCHPNRPLLIDSRRLLQSDARCRGYG